MNWFQSIIYGIVTGLSEFLPISSSAHKTIMQTLFGVNNFDPIRDVVVHIGVLIALLIGAGNLIETVKRERRMASKGARVYNQVYRGNMDYRLVKSAAIPMLILYTVFVFLLPYTLSLPIIAVILIANGILLYMPSRMIRGNKDARSMTWLDSFIIGILGAASAFSGISRVGIQTSVATMRGADRTHATNWALLLSIPILFLMIIADIIGLISGFQNIVFSANVLGYILMCLFSFGGAYLAIAIVRQLSVKTGLSAFAYYCWGAGLFTYIIYLI